MVTHDIYKHHLKFLNSDGLRMTDWRVREMVMLSVSTDVTFVTQVFTGGEDQRANNGPQGVRSQNTMRLHASPPKP
jgi:hypothetical protein